MNAREVEVENPRHGADQESLGEAGHTDDQAVAAGEEGEQDLLDHLVLTDDPLAHLGDDPIAIGRQPFCELEIVRGILQRSGSERIFG